MLCPLVDICLILVNKHTEALDITSNFAMMTLVFVGHDMCLVQ